MSPTVKAVSQTDGTRFGKLRDTTVSTLWAMTGALAIVFLSWLPAGAADTSTSTPQIQGEHLRIEFDRSLHSRVVARFDGTETAMGPSVASERVTIADKTTSGLATLSEQENGSSCWGKLDRSPKK
jgi:hypothetical protein